MCGICGYIGKKEITRDTLIKMNDTMQHRGPDDSGTEIFGGMGRYTIALAHRRLSIIDLSPLGHQPMDSVDGRLTVVFNGEIYNYNELREELQDYPFRSKCDTEVILASYLRWGSKPNDWIKRLNGMFAIALYDRKAGKFFLARDRIGKKPLYYLNDGDDLVFASELKAIMLYPEFEAKINHEVIPRYLLQCYINAPDTVFHNVHKLEPGSFLTFQEGKLECEKYWDIRTEYKYGIQNRINDYDTAKGELKKHIIKAVQTRMVADVPVGTFLSGGYDSSLVTAMAQSLSESPVNTFSIGVNDEKLDEAKYAKDISQYLGTNHTELYFGEHELWEMIEDLPRYYDEPMADSSELPTMLVSKLARQKVAVALSGDGGDEFFCGYPTYRNAYIAQQWDHVGAMLNAVGKIRFCGKRIRDRYPISVRAVADNREIKYKTQIVGGQYVEAVRNMLHPKSGYLYPKYDETEYRETDWAVRRMLLDMDTYLPGDILVKVDRASMKYSLENRCPMLDTEVMRYSFRIPQKFKYYRGDMKHILKDIAYDYIPRSLLERPKQGFSIPISKWLVGGLKDRLIDYSDKGYLKRQGIFDVEYTHNLIHQYLLTGDQGAGTGNNYSRICWPFFVFQQWYEHYMLGR